MLPWSGAEIGYFIRAAIATIFLASTVGWTIMAVVAYQERIKDVTRPDEQAFNAALRKKGAYAVAAAVMSLLTFLVVGFRSP